MPSSTSHLEESGVWCADEESGDDVSELGSPSSTQALKSKTKHSGGSVDASCEVQIVDVRDIESSHKCRRERVAGSVNKYKRHIKYVPGNSFNMRGFGKKRRSSSFSKVFSYNRRMNADIMGRRSSFGIKRMPRRREVDDDDVIWPSPGMFRSTNAQQSTKFSRGPRNRTESTTTCTTTFTASTDQSTRKYNIPSRSTRSDRDYFYGNPSFTRSVSSRPSLASSTIRESGYFPAEKRTSSDAVFFIDDKPGYDYGNRATLQRDGAKTDPMAKMVEDINMRNFLEKSDISKSKRTRFNWLIKKLTWLYVITIFFIVISLLLLGLTIWLVQDSNDLRQTVDELKVIISNNINQDYLNQTLRS